MSTIVSATAFANNEIALIAWTLKVAIPDCMGFEVTRIYTDTGEERVLPAWVPFEGQKNPDWKPQTTSIWPIQKLYWSDLTVRKHGGKRDGAAAPDQPLGSPAWRDRVTPRKLLRGRPRRGSPR